MLCSHFQEAGGKGIGLGGRRRQWVTVTGLQPQAGVSILDVSRDSNGLRMEIGEPTASFTGKIGTRRLANGDFVAIIRT